jgi:putative peptide zinc metalloprotease protein
MAWRPAVPGARSPVPDEGGGVTTHPPRLRQDLIISPQRTADGQEVFVFKDPRTGRYFRFGAVEHFIATTLDGATPLDEVRRRTESRFEAALSTTELEQFVRRLDQSDLLVGADGTRTRPSRKRLLRGNLLYLRVPLLDPDRGFGRVAHHLGFLFTPRFVGTALAAMLLAGWVTLLQGPALHYDISHAGSGGAIPIFFLLMLVTVSLHECAHGLACKHFGGAVHEMGFMLIYFQPAFYCNVSDAWLFPEKLRRLWVSFTGIWLELVLWALGTLLWRVTETGTWLNLIALVLLATSGVKALLNLNPLIKLDGYYILSDWLEIPNLRKKAFRYVGDLLRSVIGFPVDTPMSVTPRERRIYLTYGIVATAASLALLVFAFVKAGRYLVEIHQPAALAIVTGFLGLKSRRRFRRLFGNGNGIGPDDEDEEPSVLLPHEAKKAPPPKPEPRSPQRLPKFLRRLQEWPRRRLAWAGALLLAFLYLVGGRMELRIGGPFSLLPERNVGIRAAIEGIVEEVTVDEGTRVRPGDRIARLSGREIAVELRKTDAQLEEAQALLRKLRAGPTGAELDVARAGVTRAEDRRRFAQGAAARLDTLVQLNGATRQEFEASQSLATTAESDLAEARARLSLLVRGSRPEDIAGVVAQVSRLSAQRNYLAAQLDFVDLVSDVDGVVATPSRQLREMEGQLVAKGALVATVFSLKSVVAQIVIPEQEIGDVRVGQPVTLRARAFPDRVFRGTVTAIATAAEGSAAPASTVSSASDPSGGRTLPDRAFIVSTRIDNSSLLLKPGMTGYVKVHAGQRRILALIARRVARVFKVEVWSWW